MRDDEERLALAMRQEDPKVAKRIALPILSSAVARKDRPLEGRVLTLLAQCENLLANSSTAHELSSRALPLLQSVGDFREEAKALDVQARSSSALGRNDQAIEAALLGLELAKRTGDAANQADAQSQLGKALFHAGCFDAARGHLPEARFGWQRLVHVVNAQPRSSASASAIVQPLVRRVLVRPKRLPPQPRQVRDDGWLLSGLEHGAVVRIVGPYVISGGWWANEIHREYHFAELRRGDCLWVYYDRNRRRWFWQGAVE